MCASCTIRMACRVLSSRGRFLSQIVHRPPAAIHARRATFSEIERVSAFGPMALVNDHGCASSSGSPTGLSDNVQLSPVVVG